ncbi:MAG: hypothetical protein P8X95_15825 [Anaerolineales bacterium]
MIEPVECTSQHIEGSSAVIQMAGCALKRAIQRGVQTRSRIELISDISVAIHAQIGL